MPIVISETQKKGDGSSSEPNTSHHSNSLQNALSYDRLKHNIKTKTYPVCVYNAVAESPLFKLPREIRDMVYDLALVSYHYGNRTSRHKLKV